MYVAFRDVDPKPLFFELCHFSFFLCLGLTHLSLLDYEWQASSTVVMAVECSVRLIPAYTILRR